MFADWLFFLTYSALAICDAGPLGAGGLTANTEGRTMSLLKYRLTVTINQEVCSAGQQLKPETRKPHLKEEPKYRSPEPLYFTAHFGANAESYTLVLDHSKGHSRGYDILYVDADRSTRITADKKFTGIADNHDIRFGPVKLAVSCGKETCSQWFLFYFCENESNEGQLRRCLHVTNAGYYEGLVTFGDQRRLLAVVDADANGLYNDFFQSTDRPGDILLIDRDGGGKLDGSYHSKQAQPLAHNVLVGDRCWQLDVSPDGSAVTVEPLNRPLGVVRAGVKDYTLLLLGDDGVLCVRSDRSAAKVPAGKYRVLRYDYTLTSESSKRWMFSGHPSKDRVMVEVPALSEVRLTFGPPLVPQVIVCRSEGEVTLSLELRGCGGESYYDVRIGAYERPPVPLVRILDAADRELAHLAFHYG